MCNFIGTIFSNSPWYGWLGAVIMVLGVLLLVLNFVCFKKEEIDYFFAGLFAVAAFLDFFFDLYFLFNQDFHEQYL